MDANQQNYIVIEQEPGISKITGQPYVKITLVGTHDELDYTTYIDTANHNQKNWFHITNNPQHGYILSNLKVKRHKDKRLINADSKPIIQAEDTSKDRILKAFQEVLQERQQRKINRFKDLFDDTEKD